MCIPRSVSRIQADLYPYPIFEQVSSAYLSRIAP